MARCRTHIEAPPEAVYQVLLDAASYRIWVPGSKRIRGVDPSWPAVGSRFHHIVGMGPFTDRDTTQILEREDGRLLALEARIWPFGTARVTVTLAPSGGGCDATIEEVPLDGPAKRFDGPAMEAALKVRNQVALRRLKNWAEQRHHAQPGVPVEP